MNMLSTVLLSWLGLTALGLLASALIVVAEVRLDDDAQACRRAEPHVMASS